MQTHCYSSHTYILAGKPLNATHEHSGQLTTTKTETKSNVNSQAMLDTAV